MATPVLSTRGDVALEFLRRVVKSTEVFPPLQNVAELALHILEIVKDFHTNRNEWRGLGKYVRDATASVAESLSQVNVSQGDSKDKLEKLKYTLDGIVGIITSEQALPWHKRLGRFTNDTEMIAEMRRRIDKVIVLFQLSATVTTMMDVGRTFDVVVANGRTCRGNNAENIATGIGSHPRQAAADTRRFLEPGSGVPTKSGGAEIMLFTGVAGAGKTTVAHTVARECQKLGQLGSSFFFDRETQGRNTPEGLFPTIAADLSRIDNGLANGIAGAIERNPSLSMPQQFEELVLKPCQECSLVGPVALVIDALDEAWDNDLLMILRERASKLPGTFRIFLTSRMRPELEILLNKPHVIGVEFNIRTQSNMDDIRIYARSKLRELANGRADLEDDWPGEKLRESFIAKAGGLFIWVTTVCDYLYNCDDPTQDLNQVASATGLLENSAEDKMNKLYAKIFEGFDWTDASF
ncbi:POC1 centriolar protein A, partial [Ceratobasidium sp. 392]